jgi:Resolvase, N terminal domain
LFVKLSKGDVVIAPKLDRLFRSALDALKVVEDLKKRGVALHLLDLGGDISGNGLSKLFLTIAAAFAEAERDRIRERIGQVKADQKARGRYLGGKVPFGFRRGDGGELVPHEAEQEAIREMAALRAQGKALRAIAEAGQRPGPPSSWASSLPANSPGSLRTTLGSIGIAGGPDMARIDVHDFRPKPASWSASLTAEGAVVFAKACELSLEGIVSKREGSFYRCGRSRNWLKAKNLVFVRT